MKDEKHRHFLSSFIVHPSSFFFLAWLIVFLCCILPLLWIVIQIALTPQALTELRMDWFRVDLLLRTMRYNMSVGMVATLLALPVAWTLGRGRGFLSRLLWHVLPISLLMPSLVIAYGWKQFLRLLGFDFYPAGFWDVSRCVWSLATWLWPVPAMVIGMGLRKSDPQVQQAAMLDGALHRVMLRQVAGPIIASLCIVSLVAMQEFAVYEPTGISVVATELRMVFDTGAFSSVTNSMTQPITPLTQATDFKSPEQSARAAATIAAAMPMLGAVAILGLIAFLATRKLSAAEDIDAGAWPAALDAPKLIVLLAWLVVAATMAVPIAALFLSLKVHFNPLRMWQEFSPQITGTLIISAITGIAAMLLALAASPRLSRGPLIAAVLSFLLGGQILAITLIRMYNRPWLSWIYDGAPIMVMAYIGRFGWIVLAAAMMTWSRPWRPLRDLAAVDGADSMQTARHVIWPLAWPILGAAALFVLILSLSEVPATVLISPQRPQMLVPMLMNWLHMLRYDAMIEASLILAGAVILLGLAAIILISIAARMHGKWKMVNGNWMCIAIFLFPFSFFHLVGCDQRSKPQAVWCTTGIGPGQVVFPRGIAYSREDDSFYVVDRQARIQHLNHDGQCLAMWRTPEWAQGKPVGLAIGPDGNIYVPDTHYHRVLVYSPVGQLLRQWGSAGMEPGQFIYPTDIAFDSKGNIFVSEYGDNDRVQVFDQNLKFLYQFGHFGDGPGQFSRPQSMVMDGDTLYISDSCNHRIDVFKTDGTFVRSMGKPGSGLGEMRFPYGLAMDSAGHLIVSEYGNDRIQLIDKQTGRGISIWGAPGREPGQFAYPWGVAVDKRNRVVAVDAANDRLQVFEF